MSMATARLDKYGTIQTPSTTQDAATGQYTPTWSTFLGDRSMSIEPLLGKELLNAQQIQSTVTHRIRMWFEDGILPKMRITHDSRVFQIVSIINRREHGELLEIMCAEAID